MSKLSLYINAIPIWKSGSMRYRYPRVVGEFVSFVGDKDKYTKADIISFINSELKRGISPSTIRWKYYALRNFFDTIGQQINLQPGELPSISDVNAPTLSRDDISKMITAVKSNSTMSLYLALSTTYGLRRSELRQLSDSSIIDNSIVVRTSKGGMVRRHIIPEQIQRYVIGQHFKNRSDAWFGILFRKIAELSGVKYRSGMGFHTIRRSLVTELLNSGIEIPTLVYFMGWNVKSVFGSFGIAGVYFRPNSVDVDNAIFNKHPFLNFWSDNGY